MTPGKFILLCQCHQAVPDLRVVTLCIWDGNRQMSSYWPFITDFSGLTTYALKTYDGEISVLATCNGACNLDLLLVLEEHLWGQAAWVLLELINIVIIIVWLVQCWTWPFLRVCSRLVWRVRGKIITSVLCSTVCNNCTQWTAHTYEQT